MARRITSPYWTLLVQALTCQGNAIHSAAHGSCLLVLRHDVNMNKTKIIGASSLSTAQRSDHNQTRLAAAQTKLTDKDCWSDPIQEPTTAFLLMLAGICIMIILTCCLRWLGGGGGGGENSLHRANARTEGKCEHQPSAKIIQSLEWLRVLFIAIVVWFHLYSNFPGAELYKNCPMGYFTVLAGFVRTVSIGDQDMYSLRSSFAYAAKVIARLGPSYWVALILLFLLVDDRTPLVAWPVQAVFLQAFFPVCVENAPYQYFPLAGNMVAWFVSAIIIPSCCFPAAFNLFAWFGTNRNGSHALAGLGFFFALRCYLLVYITAKNAYVRGLEFYMGMLLGQLCSLKKELLLSWPHWTWFSYISLLAVLVIPCLLNGTVNVDAASVSDSNGLILFWCVFITSAWAHHEATGDNVKTVAAKYCLFDLIPLVPLAKYSFGAYIYTFVARAIYDLAYPNPHSWFLTPGFAAVVFALAWAIAASSYNLLEARIKI